MDRGHRLRDAVDQCRAATIAEIRVANDIQEDALPFVLESIRILLIDVALEDDTTPITRSGGRREAIRVGVLPDRLVVNRRQVHTARNRVSQRVANNPIEGIQQDGCAQNLQRTTALIDVHGRTANTDPSAAQLDHYTRIDDNRHALGHIQ